MYLTLLDELEFQFENVHVPFTSVQVIFFFYK